MSRELDIKQVAERALRSAESLLRTWFPAGVRKGHEYVLGGLDGSKGRSLSINIQTGAWADFATGESGGDLVSLLAARDGIGQLDAAKELAEQLGIQVDDHARQTRPVASHDRRDVSDKPASPPLMPPRGAPFSGRHSKLGEPVGTWVYRDADGQVIHYVCRYDTPSGKEIRPWTWDGKEWQPKALPENRPLYGLEALAERPQAAVVIVEGEKAADAARQIWAHAGKTVVVTWSGGSNAVHKTDWSPLTGRRIVVWPDADEPGRKAAADIARILLTQGADALKIVDPVDRPEGWDLADALEEGLEAKDLNSAIAKAKNVSLPTSSDGKPKAEPRVVDMQGMAVEEAPPSWLSLVQVRPNGAPAKSEHNVSMILQHHHEFAGKLGFDIVQGCRAVLDRLPCDPPGREYPRRLEDGDYLRILGWMQSFMVPWQEIRDRTVAGGILLACEANPVNPIANYLREKEKAWDGQARIEQLFHMIVKGPDTPYRREAARVAILASAARMLFDRPIEHQVAVVLEGGQGVGKTLFLRYLYGYDNTVELTQIGSKDSQIQRCQYWAVEIAELAALNKSDLETVKAWVTRAVEVVRKPYNRENEEMLVRSVVWGTTNPQGDGYLRDPTGNRRWLPIEAEAVDLELLKEWRDQIWGEAAHRVLQGESIAFNPELIPQAREEQAERESENPFIPVIAAFLSERTNLDRKTDGINVMDIITRCLNGKHTDANNGGLRRLVTDALKALGWKKARSKTHRYWRPPEGWYDDRDQQSKWIDEPF